MAVTTGARKGELLALRWSDIDLENSLAFCGRTKNGDPKSLPLVPAVVAELEHLKLNGTSLLFASSRSVSRPYAFESRWQAALKQAKVRDFTRRTSPRKSRLGP
jgi:integrase